MSCALCCAILVLGIVSCGADDLFSYGAPIAPPETSYGVPLAAPLSSYNPVPDEAASDSLPDNQSMGMKMLMMAVPGIPGEDYPILQHVPDETDFSCEGRELGGYYADTSEPSQCQVFHVCGVLPQQQYSFLCPNGTIFNQEYFICDWWFNVVCSSSSQLYDRQGDFVPQASQINSEVKEPERPDTIYSAIEAANSKYNINEFSEDPSYSVPLPPPKIPFSIAPTTGYGIPLADPITEYISPSQFPPNKRHVKPKTTQHKVNASNLQNRKYKHTENINKQTNQKYKQPTKFKPSRNDLSHSNAKWKKSHKNNKLISSKTKKHSKPVRLGKSFNSVTQSKPVTSWRGNFWL